MFMARHEALVGAHQCRSGDINSQFQDGARALIANPPLLSNFGLLKRHRDLIDGIRR